MTVLTLEDMKEIAKSSVADGFKEQMAEVAAKAAEAAIAAMKAEMNETSKGNSLRKYTYKQPFSVDSQGKAEKGFEGLRYARYVKTLAASGGLVERALNKAKLSRDDEMVNAFEKAIGSVGVAGDGGNLVPTDFRNELIELLRPKVVIRSCGALEMDMPNGNITLPRQNATGTASYTGENASIVTSAAGFDLVTLSAKKLTNIMPITNELLNDPSIKSDRIILADILASMSLKENITSIRGRAGVPLTPTGLNGFCPAANKFASSGVTLSLVEADLAKMVSLLEDADVPMDKAAFIMSPRTISFLKRLRDPLGVAIYKDELSSMTPTLGGFPVKKTNTIPNNLNTITGNPNTDESEIYFADFSSIIIGETGGMRVETFANATYDEAGTIKSGVSNDVSVIRSISRHDFAPRQSGQEIAIMTGVQYI